MKAQMFNFRGWVTEVDPYELTTTVEPALKGAGFNICGIVQKEFDPHGFTILYLLAESHFALHTFPEENKTYFELSSCVETPFNVFTEHFDKLFEVKVIYDS